MLDETNVEFSNTTYYEGRTIRKARNLALQPESGTVFG